MQEGKKNWTLSRTVSVLLAVFEPFDQIWWGCTSLKSSQLLWKWARKQGPVWAYTSWWLHSHCIYHNNTTGIADFAEGKEWVSNGSLKTREDPDFCQSDCPWRLMWLLDIPAPQRGWHVAGLDCAWFMRKAQDSFRPKAKLSESLCSRACSSTIVDSSGKEFVQEKLAGAKL